MDEGSDICRNGCKVMFWTTAVTVLLSCVICVSADHCPRDRSRVIRKAINEVLIPIYEEYKVEMPESCPLKNSRDMYGDNEAHKFEENLSRWVCQYCGKAFYEEKFLDVHLESRHKGTFEKDGNKVCVADYCDLFRCDILSSSAPPDYWDIAMCKAREMQQLQYKCQKLMRSCVPSTLNGEAVPRFNDRLNKGLCSFLNCKDYWQQPVAQKTQISIATYVILGMMLSFGLMIYYYVAYIHFYTEEQVFDSSDKYNRRQGAGVYGPAAREVRRRGILSQQPVSSWQR